MRNHCFVDTSALIALNHPRDQYHREALEKAALLNSFHLFLSDIVIHETYTLLRYRVGYPTACFFLAKALDGRNFEMVEITPALRKKTLKLLGMYHDHNISYCDALSTAIVKEYGIQRIFAFDHHFEIMGLKTIS